VAESHFFRKVSLILFASHTMAMNPAKLYVLLKAYRAVYIAVAGGLQWDDPVPHVSPRVAEVLYGVSGELQRNAYAYIIPPIPASYDENDYDYVIFTDASVGGWGAVLSDVRAQTMRSIQKRWDDEIVLGADQFAGPPQQRVSGPQEEDAGHDDQGQYSANRWAQRRFQQKYSAHAEPRAVLECLKLLDETGRLPNGSRVALVTDHVAIVLAQRKSNGYGGIGRGGSLNLLYEWVYNAMFERGIVVQFFYVPGPQNPADTLSRQFSQEGSLLLEWDGVNVDVPFLRTTYCPLCAS